MQNVYISRLIAAVVSALGTYLANEYLIFGFLLDPENIEALTAVTSGLGLGIYALVHKKLSQRTNPADTASDPAKAATKLDL